MKPSEYLKKIVLQELFAQRREASEEVSRYQEKLAKAREEAKSSENEYKETVEAIKELESKGL